MGNSLQTCQVSENETRRVYQKYVTPQVVEVLPCGGSMSAVPKDEPYRNKSELDHQDRGKHKFKIS